MGDPTAHNVGEESELLDSPFQIAQLLHMAGQPARRGTSESLWRCNSDLAAAALYEPFVLALAQGTLPK